jgi:hypothetical protein
METPYDYIKNPSYKVDLKFEKKSGNKVEANSQGILKYNRDYLIIIPKETKFGGAETTEEKVLKFTTQYKPIYCSIVEVKSVLRELEEFFSNEEILKEIRNAGQKTHFLLKIQSDANQEDYEEIEENDLRFLAINQFCIYESARHLVNRLVSDLIKNEGALPGGSRSSSISLGDFSMSTGSSSSSASSKQESIFGIVKENLKIIDEEVNFWKESLLGRRNRGYSSPRTAITRKNVAAPNQRGV